MLKLSFLIVLNEASLPHRLFSSHSSISTNVLEVANKSSNIFIHLLLCACVCFRGEPGAVTVGGTNHLKALNG